MGRTVKGNRRGSPEMSSTFDEDRNLKKMGYEAEVAKQSESSEESKGGWIFSQCEEIETCPNKKNSKSAYQLVKDLISEKQGSSSTILDRSWKCLTKEKGILSRWTEYCSELNNHERCGDNAVLVCSQPQKESLQLIFREEAEIVVASLKKGTLQEMNIPTVLVQAGGETMTDVLTEICNRIWRTGLWPTP